MSSSIFTKGLQFIKKYLLKDPIFVVKYLLAYPQKKYSTNAKFYKNEEFIEQLKRGKSLIRIGDGEIGLLHGIDISYQKHSKELENGLRDSISEYNDTSPYILAIPVFVNDTNDQLRLIERKLNCWLPLKIEFNRIFNKKTKYADAHFFYYKNNFEKFLEPYLLNKKLIINTTKENITAQKEFIEKKFTVLGWVEAKSPDPFAILIQTKKEIDLILEKYEESDGDKKDIVLILSAGPMSKVLAHTYSKEGVQALDIGKGFEHIYNNNNFEHHI